MSEEEGVRVRGDLFNEAEGIETHVCLDRFSPTAIRF